VRGNNSADTKVSEEGGGGGLPDAEAETFPLQPMMKTMVWQAVPCRPWSSKVGQITCSLWKTPCWSRWMPDGGCDPVGSPR